MLGPIVYAAEQHILQCHSLLGTQRHLPYRFDHVSYIPFPRHRHNAFAHSVVRRIQRDCQLWPHRFRGETQDPGHNPRGRDRHSRLGNIHLLHQQPHRRHKGVVVQEGLTHSHEDQVDSIAAGFGLLPLEHRRDLTGDLSGCQVADDSQLRRQAELATHRAANLARDADRRPRPGFLPQILVGRRLIAVLATVALGHPNCFDRLAIVSGDQISFCAIHGPERLDDLR